MAAHRETASAQRAFGGSPDLRLKLAVAATVLAGALLLLLGLGVVRLWQDEAETALLGRNTLRFGLPRVWDGRNLIAQHYSLDYDRRLLFPKGWLPPYLVAASFALFGESTGTARLPFALLGVATLWLCSRVALRLTQDGVAAVLAPALLVSCLPFLLYARECRWYALAMLLTLVLFEAEHRLAERRQWVVFAVAGAALFHTNSLVCAATVGGLLLGRLAVRGPGSFGRPLLGSLLLAGALCLPFVLLFPPFAFAREATQLGDYPQRIAWMAGDLNRWILPLPLVALAVALRRGALLRRAAFVLPLLALGSAVLLAAVPMWNGLVGVIGFRYVVNLLPMAAILLAQALRSLPRPLGAAAIALHLVTHLLGWPLSSWVPPRPDPLLRLDLVEYAGGLAYPPKGPIDAAVEYLAPRVRPDDRLFTPYEQLPFQFYLPVSTVGLQGAAAMLPRIGVHLPDHVVAIDPGTLDWYVPRRNWLTYLGAPPPAELLSMVAGSGKTIVEAQLRAPDLPWQTREYPPFHPFRAAPDVPRVSVFRFTAAPSAAPKR